MANVASWAPSLKSHPYFICQKGPIPPPHSHVNLLLLPSPHPKRCNPVFVSRRLLHGADSPSLGRTLGPEHALQTHCWVLGVPGIGGVS